MKHKSIQLLLWAIFLLLLALYLLYAFTWELLSLGLMAAAIVFAVCSWIVGYISDDDSK